MKTEKGEIITLVPTEELFPSSMNPRIDYGTTEEMEQLASTIKQVGILEPMRARKQQSGLKGYEIIMGHRRHRAAGLAGLTHCPVVIVEADDEMVATLQLIENLCRKDLKPLEEASGFMRLVKGLATKKLKVSDIAFRTGKPDHYVRKMLVLAEMHDDVKVALEADWLPVRIALLIARIPVKELQANALKDITLAGATPGADTKESAKPRVRGYSESKRIIEEKYMNLLKSAPFDLEDKTLNPKQGACGGCQYRVGNSRQSGLFAGMFADVTNDDVCTLPPCYQTKVDVTWTRTVADAESRGVVVLSEEEVAELFPFGNGHLQGSEYIDLMAVNFEDPQGRTYAALVEDRADKYAARDPLRAIRWLAKKKQVDQIILEIGYDFAVAKDTDAREKRDQAKVNKVERSLAKEVNTAIKTAVIAAVKGTELHPDVWIEVLAMTAFMKENWQMEEIYRRYNMEPASDVDIEQKAMELVSKMDQDEMLSILVDLHIFGVKEGAAVRTGFARALCKQFGVDYDAIALAATTAFTERANKRAARKPKADAKEPEKTA